MDDTDLRARIYDAVSDCYCKPGDPTCKDWIDAWHRWRSLADAVMAIVAPIVERAERLDEILAEAEGMLAEFHETIGRYVPDGVSVLLTERDRLREAGARLEAIVHGVLYEGNGGTEKDIKAALAGWHVALNREALE